MSSLPEKYPSGSKLSAKAAWEHLFAVWALMLLLAGCPIINSGSKIPAEPFTAPLGRRVIPQVPFIADDSAHCGPSSLAAVLTFHGRPTTKEEVAVDVQRADLRGSLGPDLVLWARAQGFKAGFSSMKPQELIANIDRSKPVIVLLDTGMGPVRKGHFAVAVGYASDGLVLNTGVISSYLMPWPEVLTQWYKMSNFAILVEGLADSGDGRTSAEPAADSAAGGFSGAVDIVGVDSLPVSLAVPAAAKTSGEEGPTEDALRPTFGQTTYKIPSELRGADIDLSIPASKEPIIFFVGRPKPGSEPEIAPEELTDQIQPGITEHTLSPHLIQGVVPLPEAQGVGAFKKESSAPEEGGTADSGAASGSATSTASGTISSSAGGQAAPQPPELVPVMGWETGQ
ncbi:MAG: C39 family peptidase [Deltaproteobacteria bacterium]|nr:C39 family peptidase [Deltaproteobacteria bacterium]